MGFKKAFGRFFGFNKEEDTPVNDVPEAEVNTAEEATSEEEISADEEIAVEEETVVEEEIAVEEETEVEDEAPKSISFKNFFKKK